MDPRWIVPVITKCGCPAGGGVLAVVLDAAADGFEFVQVDHA